MIEADVFLVMFALQTLAMSVVYPAWFMRYLRLKSTAVPAQPGPGTDRKVAREQFFARYRALNAALAALGFLLLAGLFTYTRRPQWQAGFVETLVAVYALLQTLVPLGFLIRHGVRFNAVQAAPARKRRALLQRRFLFDFVSPLLVALAAVGYVVCVGLVIYTQQHVPGPSPLICLGGVTLVYAAQASVIWAVLYGKNPHRAGGYVVRERTIGLVVKACVGSSLACAVFVSLTLSLALSGWRSWGPLILSAFLVSTALLSLPGMTPGRMTPGPRVPGAGARGGAPAAPQLHQ